MFIMNLILENKKFTLDTSKIGGIIEMQYPAKNFLSTIPPLLEV